MVGYVNDKDGYRIWIPSQKKVIYSHDVIFKQEIICNIRNEVEVVEKVNETKEDKKNEEKDGQNEIQEENYEDENDKNENNEM